MSLEKFLDQVDDGVDPRVQVELERLNSATDDINKLEVDLDEARNQFRQLLQESTSQIESCAKKLGSCIVKVRPYYDARIKAKEALQETQKAAVNFERANSAHAAAKEMVYLAEEGLKTEGRTFDHAWQEMLNHATMRVNESESERTRSEAEHKRTSQNYQLAEIRVRTLQKELKRAITKSRPYFELKIHYNQLLEKQKNKVKNLEKQVTEVKLSYAHTLKNLEQISDEIHKTRQKNKHFIKTEEKRTEGVGAESDSSSEFSANAVTKSGGAKTMKNFQNLSKPKAEVKVPDVGDESETGKNHRIYEPPMLLTPLSDTHSSNQTITPNTTTSSQPDTDIWSECSDLGNLEASPNSENDSSLTGPPDTESEDEIFKFPQQLNCIGSSLHKLKQKAPTTDLKAAGDSKADTNMIENFSQFLNCDKNLAPQEISKTKTYTDNKPQSYFEGVGFCSFPIQTELNLEFKEDDKPPEENTASSPNSNWTEIKLCSPEEETFSTMKTSKVSKSRNELEEDFDIPYAPLSEIEGEFNGLNRLDEKKAELIVESVEEKNGLDEVTWDSEKSGKKEVGNEEMSAKSLKSTPRKLNLRRQSLDVLWNNTAGEKMKEILSQSIMKLNIGSLTEKKANDSKICEGTEYCENENSVNGVKGNENRNDGTYESNLTSQFGIHFFNRKNSKVEDDITQNIAGDEKKAGNPQDSISTQLGGFISRKERFFTKKVPSPLEKTLNYLNPDDESNSDSESLASSDMLSDEQLTSLVLDRDLTEIYQDII